MRVRALLLALLVLAPLAPVEAKGVAAASFPQAVATAFVTPDPACDRAAANATVAAGSVAHLCLRWRPLAGGNGTANLTLTLAGPDGWTVPANASARVNLSGAEQLALRIPVTLPADAAGGEHTILGTLTLTANGTDTARATAWTVEVPTPPAAGPPWLLLGALAVLAAVGAGATYALVRRRQVRAAPRSAAMRQAEVEKRLEKAKEPEERAAIEAEAVAEEEQRALSREASIVEAKIADVRKGLDRLRERREAGQLTEHQFNQMRAKREQQLEELQRELENLRGG